MRHQRLLLEQGHLCLQREHTLRQVGAALSLQDDFACGSDEGSIESLPIGVGESLVATDREPCIDEVTYPPCQCIERPERRKLVVIFRERFHRDSAQIRWSFHPRGCFTDRQHCLVARCFVIFRDPQVRPNQGVMVIEGACGMVLKRCFFFGSGEFVGYIPGRALRFPVRNVRNVTPCSLYFIAIAV